jgi:hypothetical protein
MKRNRVSREEVEGGGKGKKGSGGGERERDEPN